jgi:hypothetical protein
MTAFFGECKFKLKRLKYVASIKSSNVDKIVTEGEQVVRLCNYVDVYYNERVTNQIIFSEGSASARELIKFGLQDNDVIITKDSETPDDIAVPALVCAGLEGVVCGYHLALLHPHHCVMRGDFLFWCLKSRPVRNDFSTRAQGITRFGLTLDGIGNVLIPEPDLATQTLIAEFLDRETARVDRMIGHPPLLRPGASRGAGRPGFLTRHRRSSWRSPIGWPRS